jgi:F-type H+-transporting ATPase subunit gamma
MANLRDIRNRIGSVNNTQQITKAMKMVAAAKLRKAQEHMVQTRPYASKIQDIVSKLVKGSDVSNKLMHIGEDVTSVLMIIVGSDRGLCGGFNNNLFKEVEKEIEKKFQSFREKKTLGLITIGKKATAHFSKRNYNIISSYPGFFDNLEYHTTSEIMSTAIGYFLDKEYDEVYVAYNEFRSVIAQNRKIEKLLPIDPVDLEGDETVGSIDYIYEPDSSEILDQLLPLHLNTQLWKAVLESNASEQGARMSAMDSATENAKELERELRLKYNQARQSAITTEISEIVSGAQALSDS